MERIWIGNESQKTLHQPDGRILGKMAYSERINAHILRNIPGDKDRKIFPLGMV